MSTFYSNPSPSKATTSTKRPYESTTPSNLGTPRDSSTNNGGRSPGANKKYRSNEEVKDIGRGGQWMIAKLDELQRMYKEVLLAATAVIQYQTYALRLGRKARTVPVHLQRRVKIAWGNFEATRRHVQAYMNEAAADASTPSSKHLTISVPLPPSASLSIPQASSSTAPLASPIPLSATTMLPFPGPPTSAKTEVKNDFEFNILPTLPGNNGLDLGNMNMSDFAAMMANTGFDYSAMSQQTTQNNNLQSNPAPLPISTNPRPSVNREQSDTDRLLAQLGAFNGPDTSQNQPQLGAFNGPDTSQNQAQAQQSTTAVNDDEVNALLASLNDGNVGGGDYSNFDFGDIDLGSLGDMSGLFNTSTVPDVSNAQAQSGSQQTMQIPPNTNTNIHTNIANANTMLNANPIPSTNTIIPNTQPPQVSSQPQPQAPQPTQPQQPQAQAQQPIPPPIKQEPPNTIKQETPNTTNTVPPTDPNLDMSHVFDDSQAIDLDDFNFGDGDGEEGGIDLTGDEFENLLAAFN